MVRRMHSVSQKPDRGENRMTEEERMREVERISRRTKESVKIPPDQQRIIRIVRFKSGKLVLVLERWKMPFEMQNEWKTSTDRSNT